MPAHPQIQQRRHQVARARNRRKRRWRLYLPLSLLALGALAFWVVFYSPLLDVDEVEVTGLNRTRPEQVSAITDQLLGDPLVTADMKGVRRLILELPWVGAAEVSRSWRRGTVYVDIRERTPVAVLLRADSYLLLDIDGRVLQSQPEQEQHLLIESSDWTESPSGRYEAAVPALQVAQELAKHPQLVTQVASVNETTSKTASGTSTHLFLKLANSGWVDLKDTRELTAKLNSVETFLAHSQVDCGQILNVDSPVAPAIREGALCDQ